METKFCQNATYFFSKPSEKIEKVLFWKNNLDNFPKTVKKMEKLMTYLIEMLTSAICQWLSQTNVSFES